MYTCFLPTVEAPTRGQTSGNPRETDTDRGGCRGVQRVNMDEGMDRLRWSQDRIEITM